MAGMNIFSKMAGTEAMVRFVKEIERHPCLYDQKSLDYADRELKRKTWIEIAKKYNSTVKECKGKWIKIRIAYIRTLRPSYAKEMRKNLRSPYYLANHLKFITPVKKNNSNYSRSSPSSSENNHQLDETNETDTNTADEPLNDLDYNSDSKEYDNSQHQVFLDEDNNYFDNGNEIINDDTEIDTKEILLDEINKIKVKEVNNTSENSGRIVKKRPCCDNIECNPRKMFLLSLLPDVETLTEKQMRSFRRHVINLIDNVIGE
ncbi:uncharacterized protein LOC123877370 [Maniola jurtina]|uniref:uncharacterized protein LOC123877370 n=1 Tax=Maniola jurtina TaxID=191418 RepID=UPI001E687F38|nr:uncharacterized protein LOC123877370 [Maniola jurtina]